MLASVISWGSNPRPVRKGIETSAVVPLGSGHSVRIRDPFVRGLRRRQTAGLAAAGSSNPRPVRKGIETHGRRTGKTAAQGSNPRPVRKGIETEWQCRSHARTGFESETRS